MTLDAFKSYPWATREESYKNTLKYLTGRLKGEIKSVLTPWPKVNEVGAKGLEIHTSIAFCARPACGKTVVIEQFCRELYTLNPGRKMRILKLQLEMLNQVVDIREFSSVLGESYSYMCSAEESPVIDDFGQIKGTKKLTIEELKKCWDHVVNKTQKTDTGEHKFPENVIEVAPTIEEFEQIIDSYMETYKDESGYVDTLICIDHARLIKKKPGQSELDMLAELGPMLNRKKKQYPLIIVLANHLKREINSDARSENGKYGNYIRDEDVYGGDNIYQNFDIIVGIDRPSLRQITKYGPSNYIIEDEYVLIFHFLKVRNGSPGMTFMRGEFNKMRIVEIPTPPKATAKLNTQKS